ncbi:hypothetical protein F0562_032412 [Nyssa sinensis]|uniref:UvrD-like helicase ATP-binding domain-containing protein n=1 Tax=Nyssa sinensis TaxID=561372 RepID=A0A5J5AMV3_9ASTE|nr:hypothetical protein F0562_032412 [Nyssa sinensis]
MMEGSPSYMEKAGVPKDSDLIDLLFSWSLEDIKNDHLYQVEKIPESFQSVQHYLNSFVSPLLEETRAELWSSIKDISRKPFATLISINESKPYGRRYYDVKVDYLRNRYGDDDDKEEEAYRALPGDIIVLKEPLSDLQGGGRAWMLGNITEISGNIAGGNHFKVKTSNDLGVGVEAKHGMHKSLHIVFLMNITSTKRTWKALHMLRNLEVINKALCTHSAPVVEETCNQCSVETNEDWAEKLGLSSMLNESQHKAVVACISKMVCKHKCFVELIWGPPGTGKTTTLSILLWTLLHLKCRTLTCAPTNVAIRQVASRVLRLLLKQSSCCCLGDILLFGNKDQLKVGNSEFEEIYLDYRVEKLAECFGPVNGWKRCFTSMIEFLEEPVLQYQNFCENDLINEKATSSKDIEVEVEVEERKSFLGFVRDRFKSIASPLTRCVSTFCTHVPKSFIKEHNFLKMMSIADSLDSFESLLYQKNLVSEELKVLFSEPKMAYSASQTCSHTPTMLYMRSECLFALRTLRSSLDDLKLPNVMNKDAIENFCFQMASSIFCTASSSYKLHSKSKAMEPLQLLVIDEAAQLKECESIIPLQLPGIRHAILIGDQCQLPAMVTSNVSKEAGFGRSLFGRLNHSKHLLNTQYRMHPSISFFPKSKFYQNQIMDASCVKSKSYKKCYLPGPVFGPYSFINISGGKEVPVGHSLKNMVEVAVVKKIVEMLYKACNASEEKLSIGVVSPYAAQVAAIQQNLGHKYEDHGSFSVKVKSIDGFQGGEEDIIILSTVRSTSGESIEFISSPHRTNVALTRARYCLWILGNESTLTNSESIWKELICDAKVRHCFFDAGEVQNLANFILKVKTELDQLDELLNADSMLFKSARWKIRFNDNFRKSFVKLKSSETKNSVLYLLLKLSSGRRPKGICVDIICERSSHILKQFKVGRLYVVCSIDIVKESCYIQVLSVWDIMPLEDIQKLVKRLDNIFETYTDDYLNRCKVKCMEGMLEVPMSWATSSDIVQYKDISKTKTGKDASAGAFDEKGYGENSKLSDCLLLLKFYALSSDVVSHLLSSGDGRELGPSFELTDQQKEIIHYNRSTFILGRSGTGKTAILTRKLFQNEQLYRIASGLDEVKSKASESDGETKGSILHQIFVTVSPKLCHAIKQDVSQLKSFVCGGNSSAESSSIHMDDINDTAQFADMPDSFVDLPPRSYPLVITFHKFLMMLDGTVGTSYFERFPDLTKNCHGKTSNSTSVALETFISTKEVNYDRFSSTYWPRFNVQLTKKLECSSVFTEIMSVIKGAIQAGEASNGKLSREEYVSLSDGKGYEGDHMDFVYIDEVQDLSMSQISLFKYMCRNVDEGFVFAGDTAQTIARGIDFSFEDIRCLFYKEFLMGLKRDVTDERREKGKISEIFHLSHNFCTHAGVLNLAQSVVDPLYHFFPSSIDKLSPENSPLCGEAPILLESKDNEDAIITIFENSGNGGNVVSFGAEQVILVRDDFLRESISHYIGKKALVLTILECKGLEFQFFHEHMYKMAMMCFERAGDRDWERLAEAYGFRATADRKIYSRDSKLEKAGECFSLAGCYKLAAKVYARAKLYSNCLSACIDGKLFDLGLEFIQSWEQGIASSADKVIEMDKVAYDFLHRGALYYYELKDNVAMMKFVKSFHTIELIRTFLNNLDCIDELFSLEKEMGNFLEAANIAKKKGDLFLEADVVEKAGLFREASMLILWYVFSNCLEQLQQKDKLLTKAKSIAKNHSDHFYEFVCEEADILSKERANEEVLDMRLMQFLQYWKQNAPIDVGRVKRSYEIDIIEKKLLKEVAKIAEQKGDLLCMADLLERAGDFKEASMVLLWYCFASSF